MREAYKYDAFISYSHTEDNLLAPAIQTALQRIKMPWHGLSKPVIKIFRDATSLKNASKLTESIKEGIKNSRKFVLLSSPKAKDSTWVNQELEFFKVVCKERNVDPCDNIVIVLTHGSIQWSYDKKEWDLENTNALPLSLYNCYSDVPIWVDLKDVKIGTKLDIKGSIFENSIIRVAAFILDTEPSEIDSIELRKRKTKRKILLGVIASLLLMLVISIRLTISEKKAVQDEIEARLEADTSRNEAISEKVKADTARIQAEKASILAESRRIAADTAKNQAIRSGALAETRRVAADTAKNQAVKAGALAEARRVIAEVAKKQADIAKDNEKTARLSTDRLNRVLLAENLAITSLNPSDSSEARAIKASKIYYSTKFKDPKHLAKRSTIYYGLYQAYQNRQQVSEYIINHNFEIEKISRDGNAIDIHDVIDKRYVYTLQYIPEVDLILKSLENHSIQIGSRKYKNFASVTASDFFIRADSNSITAHTNDADSTIITGHDNGKVEIWKYINKDSIEYKSTLFKLPNKVIWLSQINNDYILAATHLNLYLFAEDKTLSILRNFDKEKNSPTTLYYSRNDKLLFTGYQSGSVEVHKMREIENKMSYVLEELPEVESSLNFTRDTKEPDKYKADFSSPISSPISVIKYDSNSKIVAFSNNSGRLTLFSIDQTGNSTNHYEIVSIKYQQPIKDILFNENNWIIIALKNRIIKWPVTNELLYQELTSTFLMNGLLTK